MYGPAHFALEYPFMNLVSQTSSPVGVACVFMPFRVRSFEGSHRKGG